MGDQVSGQMARTRALMTETERKYIARSVEVSDSKRYQAISRVRDRLERLEADVETLREHHPELLADIRTMICEEEETSDE